MKNALFTSIALLMLSSSFAQNFHGTVYYASQTQMKDFNITSDDMTPAMKEQIMEKMKKSFEKTFVLYFNSIESVYREEEKLNSPNPGNNSKTQMAFMGGDHSKIYKNFKTKQYIKDIDFFGKEFLIVDSLQVFKWTILDEQKKIGNYNCTKAKIIIPVTAEELKEYETQKTKQKEGKTNFFAMQEPKEEIIEAWFTSEIPISNGPNNYWGLPGLILELHDGPTSYLCSKIVLNSDEEIEIKAPKNGKKVTQKEFDDIKEKKIKSMTNENGAIEIRMN